MAYKLNDKTFRVDRAFTLNQIQYPRNWLQLSTKEDRDALGITWEDDPVRADDRYYWNGEIDNPKAMENVDAKDQDGNQIYVQVWNPETEEMEDTEEKLVTRGLKFGKIAEVKHTANTLLAPTDWYIVKSTEVADYNVPDNILSFRADVRSKSNQMETQIDACTTVDELKALYEYTTQEDGTQTRPLAEFPKEI